jgi:polar amino acid transport system substrate-binding protein
MGAWKTWRLLALVAVLALGLAACPEDDAPTVDDDEEVAEDTDDLELIQDGALVVCTDVPYPPFEFEDPDAPSGYSGFDIDLMQEVADRLDLTLEVVNTGFDPIESGVAMQSDQCDIAAAAMTITDDRAENINFTDPYFDADQSLLAKGDSDIETLDDLAGQTLGVQSATTGEAYANENAPEDAEIVSFEDPGDLFTALDAGEIDAVLQDLPVNSERAREDDSVEVVDTFETGESYGFGAKREGKENLVDAINATLDEMRDDGTYDEIYDQYFEA